MTSSPDDADGILHLRPLERSTILKAVLSLPKHWKTLQLAKTIQSADFQATLGHVITQGLKLTALIYQNLPTSFPLTIEWMAQPENCQPTLRVEVDGTRQSRLSCDLDIASHRLAVVLSEFGLATTVPDCELHLRIIFDRVVSID